MPDTLIRGRISRNLPQPDVDGARDGEPFRAGRFGDQYALMAMSPDMVGVDESSYYVGTNLRGTAISGATGTQSFSDAAALFLLTNTSSASDPTSVRRIIPDYIRFNVTGAPASATAMHLVIGVDKIERWSSGGTKIQAGDSNDLVAAIINPNMDSGIKSIARIDAGALVLVASSSSRRIIAPRLTVRTVIPVIGDQYTIRFGKPDSTASVLNGTNPQIMTFGVPSFELGPGQCMMIHAFWPAVAVTGMTFEFDEGHWER